MEIIKTYQKTGYVLSPEVVSAVSDSGCSLSVFSSPSGVNGLDRENHFKNYVNACAYRNGKPYSILMDDDILINKEAIELMVDEIKRFDIVTCVIEKYRAIQHACIIIRNEVLDKFPIKYIGSTECNHCHWFGDLIDRKGVNVKALRSPVLKTVKRKILKRK